MPLSQAIGVYDDIVEYLQRAMDAPHGIRVQFATEAEAMKFQLRCHQLRTLERKESMRIYQPEEPQYGRSDFDKLVIRRPIPDPDDLWWVYIETVDARVIAVEELD